MFIPLFAADSAGNRADSSILIGYQTGAHLATIIAPPLRIGTFVTSAGTEDECCSINGMMDELVVFDSESVRHTPLHDPYSTVVYSLQASDVKDVFVSGKQVVDNGILVNSDLNQITNKAREFISKWPSL